MKTLERKVPEDIARELDEEIIEVGADFADKVGEKLKKYGYHSDDMETRREIVSAFLDLRRWHATFPLSGLKSARVVHMAAEHFSVRRSYKHFLVSTCFDKSLFVI